MLANVGTTELLIVAGVIILFFGSRKLRELARGLGESTKEVKKIKKELTPEKNDEDKKQVEDL